MKQFTTGEAAKISGLTIRTLQYYDNIGLLPATGRTQSGRRYYTDSDMQKLEQVVLYKNLGFTLEEMKDKLVCADNLEIVTQILERQKMLLYSHIDQMQNSIAAIEACVEIASIQKNPPWYLLSVFLQGLNGTDIFHWKDYEFTSEQKIIIEECLPTMDDVLEFYTTWKRLSIKAAAFFTAEVPPDSRIARKLAFDWNAMTAKVSGGKDENLNAYLQVDENRDMWSPAERELIEQAEPYLERVLDMYHDGNTENKE